MLIRFLAFILIIATSIVISYIINSRGNGEIAISKEEETEEDKKKKKKEEEGKSKIVLFLEKGKFAFLLDLWNNDGARSLIFAFIAWVIFNLAILNVSSIIFERVLHSNWYTVTNIILWPVLIFLGQWKKITLIVYTVVVIGIISSVILFGYEFTHPESTWVIETEKKIEVANKIIVLAEMEKKNMLKRLTQDEDTIKKMEEKAKNGKLSLEEKQEIERKKEKLKQELKELRGEDEKKVATAVITKPEPIVRIFEVPAGNGKNELENIFQTTLSVIKGAYIEYTVKEGGPILVRIGPKDAKKDRMTIKDFFQAEAYGPGTIDFIRWKKTKVEVKITQP